MRRRAGKMLRASSALDGVAPPVACGSSPARACHSSECPPCTAFLLLHKCASTTILHVLRAPIWRTADVELSNIRTRCGGAHYCDWMAHAASGCRVQGRRSYELADRERAWLYFGGYLPAIGPTIALRGCRRFALLREPVARLLSARAYCERGGKGRPVVDGGDVLCGNRSSGSIQAWAAHWGAYLFRQLALAPAVYATLSTDGQLPAPAVPHCAFPERCARGLATYTWLDQKAHFGANDDGTSTRAGRVALRSLATRLSTGAVFDVVAVYEEWNASMALLDATLPLAGGRTWVEQSHARKTNVAHAGAMGRSEQQAQLAAARGDANVTQLVAADRRLYVAGLGWFYALCRRHGLATQYTNRRAMAESVSLGDALPRWERR